jgi:hypothetical protein
MPELTKNAIKEIGDYVGKEYLDTFINPTRRNVHLFWQHVYHKGYEQGYHAAIDDMKIIATKKVDS